MGLALVFPIRAPKVRQGKKSQQSDKTLVSARQQVPLRLPHMLAEKITLAACTGRRDGLRPVKLRTAEDLTDMVEDAILTVQAFLRQDFQQHFGSR